MNSASLTSRELRQTVHCLQLYYRRGRSQKDTARALGVSAATVSRLLQRAMDEGLVRVELDLPRREQLEAGLVEQFGLRDAGVGAPGGRGAVKEELGTAPAAYFEKIAANGQRVGLSCGFTLYQTIRHLRERRFRDLVLYPLSVESTLEMVDLFPNTLVGMMAAKYRPHVSAYALPVQHLLSLREIDRERPPPRCGPRPAGGAPPVPARDRSRAPAAPARSGGAPHLRGCAGRRHRAGGH